MEIGVRCAPHIHIAAIQGDNSYIVGIVTASGGTCQRLFHVQAVKGTTQQVGLGGDEYEHHESRKMEMALLILMLQERLNMSLAKLARSTLVRQKTPNNHTILRLLVLDCSWNHSPPLRSRWGLFPSYLPRCRATLRQMATAQRPQRAQGVWGRFGAGAPRRKAKGLKNMARWKCPKVKGWSSYCWQIYTQPLRYLDIFVAGSPCPQLTHIYPGSSTSGSFSLVPSELLGVFQHVLHSNIQLKCQSDPASFSGSMILHVHQAIRMVPLHTS